MSGILGCQLVSWEQYRQLCQAVSHKKYESDNTQPELLWSATLQVQVRITYFNKLVLHLYNYGLCTVCILSSNWISRQVTKPK